MQSQKNSKGFPVGPFAEDSNEEDLLRWCMRCLIRFLILCDAFHDDDLNASPYGVLILVMINCVVYEATCPITGLALNWSFPPWHPLSPKVIAHAQHGRTGCFGLKTPYPSSVKDRDATAVSIPVKSMAANHFVATSLPATDTRHLCASSKRASKMRTTCCSFYAVKESSAPGSTSRPSRRTTSSGIFSGSTPWRPSRLTCTSASGVGPSLGGVVAMDVMHPRLVRAATKLGKPVPYFTAGARTASIQSPSRLK